MNFDLSFFEKPTFWIVVSVALAITVTIAIKIVKKKNSVRATNGSVAVGRDSHAPIKINNRRS